MGAHGVGTCGQRCHARNAHLQSQSVEGPGGGSIHVRFVEFVTQVDAATMSGLRTSVRDGHICKACVWVMPNTRWPLWRKARLPDALR